MTTAYIAVGSNIRSPDNVRAALRALALTETLAGISTVYSTLPEQRPEQLPFYNCVVEIGTRREPRVLKSEVLRSIEEDLGRVRTADRYAPRTIDLDLILYDDLVVNDPGLVLPDPQIRRRPFLAIPLAELAPDLRLPDTGEQLAAIAARMATSAMRPLDYYSFQLRQDLCPARQEAWAGY